MSEEQKKKLEQIRIEYEAAGLHEKDCDPDPIIQFQNWFDEALKEDPELANAMHLSTTSPIDRPEGRVILLKGIEDGGFVFFTNYSSRKGLAMVAHPFGALTSWWRSHHRQVRIEGTIEKISREESERYFHSRPRNSQLSAYVSSQSSEIPSRDELIDAIAKAAIEFEDKEIPCPESWGGYRLIPDRIEFWQGQTNRLHDRIEYRNYGGDWQLSRLSP